jgi:hypothetical protein
MALPEQSPAREGCTQDEWQRHLCCPEMRYEMGWNFRYRIHHTMTPINPAAMLVVCILEKHGTSGARTKIIKSIPTSCLEAN